MSRFRKRQKNLVACHVLFLDVPSSKQKKKKMRRLLPRARCSSCREMLVRQAFMATKPIRERGETMSLPKPISGQVFGLDHLFSKLLNFARSRLRQQGCHKPEDCAVDVVNECLIYEPRRREGDEKPGRIQILDENTVSVNFPGARNQQSFLYEHLKYKVREKHSRCKECKWKSAECDIADDFVDDEWGERRTGAEPASEAASPEEICIGKDIINKYLGEITDPEQREDLKSIVLDGFTKEDIARKRNKKPSMIRQRHHRNKKKVADFISRTFFKRRDE